MRRTTLAFLLLALISAPAFAEGQLTLGAGDTVYELREGTYGELFPGGREASAENEVLALDVQSQQGRVRWLVPATISEDTEGSAVLVYERESDLLYLFWESVISGIYPTLYLTSFDGAEWGELIQFLGSPFARKESLQLTVTRAPSSETATQGPDLTVLNVFWSEDRPDGNLKRYAPIVIADGTYIGSTPVYDLHTFQAASGGDGAWLPVSEGIEDALRVQIGDNAQSSIIGFVSSVNHNIATVEVELLSLELTTLAEKVRAEILPFGMTVDTLQELSDLLVARLQELGQGFHPSVLAYMTERVEELVLNAGPSALTEEGLTQLSAVIWADIIAVGSAIERSGVADDRPFSILEFAPLVASENQRHLLKVSTVAEHSAPEVGDDATLWLSDSGQHVLVTWEDEERIYFRETLDEGGWSETGSILLGAGLDRERVYRTLSDRIRNR